MGDISRLSRRSATLRQIQSGLAILLFLFAGASAAVIPNPVVTGPIATSAARRDYPFLSTILFPKGSGYIEHEFFMQGTATSYAGICETSFCAGDPTSLVARIPMVVSTGNPYKIRMIVRRPSDPAGDDRGQAASIGHRRVLLPPLLISKIRSVECPSERRVPMALSPVAAGAIGSVEIVDLVFLSASAGSALLRRRRKA